MSRNVLFALSSAALACAAIACLLVLSGRWDGVVGEPLSADLVVNDIAVPADYAIDPVVIAEELVKRMQRRSETDLALNILLGDEGNALLRDTVVPRLLNPGVVRRMVDDMDGLGTVIAFSGYRAYGTLSVTARGETLDDVALTLPHAVRAERNGVSLELKDHEGLPSLDLGSVSPGAPLDVSLWFDAPPSAIFERGAELRIGADDGLRGKVALYTAGTGWNGADLQVWPWARWLVSGLITALAVFALAALALLLAGAVRQFRLSRV